MRKKLLTALLAATALITCAFGLSACGDDENKGAVWGEEYSVQTAYAVATELGYQGTLEEFIASISGKDGTDGEDGKDGKNGIDGINGKDGLGIQSVAINTEGKLVIVFTDKTEKVLGKVTGADGKGIDKVEINSDGQTVITFTDGTSKNLGNLSACEHSYLGWETGIAPDCTSIGYDLRTCTKCGDKDYKLIAKTNHVWGDGVVLIKPTSKQTGLQLYSCTICRTAKTEVLDKIEVMSEEEWKAAVHATLMADNFTYEGDSNSPGATEPIWYEKVAFNLDNGLSYYYTDRVSDEGCKYKEEVYYKLDKEDKISFNNTSYIYESDPSKNEIYGWVYAATESDYSRSYNKEHPEEVKFDLDNHGYSMLESFGNCLTEESWHGNLLEDAYDFFEFDVETQSYDYTDEDGMIFSFKFADGYISEFSMRFEYEGITNSMIMIFSDYGTTKVTIPQELIDEAREKGLEYEYWYGLEPNTEIVVKPQYFGYNLTAIGADTFHGDELIKITIPVTVKTIGKYAFHSCRNLKDIVFGGTKAQWEAIQKGENWDEGVTHYTVHCSDVDIEGLTTYNFEAELTDLSNFSGLGFSGMATGKGAIVRDDTGANASGGFWVDYMYGKGCSLTFEFDCDKEVTDATLIFRLSARFIEELILTEEDLVIAVNGQPLQFGQIKISDIDTDIDSKIHPFDDFTVGTALNLKQGKNIVVITVTGNRQHDLPGTLQALAPMVDCIKITTTANLTWTPCTENLD